PSCDFHGLSMSTSQTLTSPGTMTAPVVLPAPETSSLLSGEKARALIGAVCPRRVVLTSLVFRSQRTMTWPDPAAASQRPSAENAATVNAPAPDSALNRTSCLRVRASQRPTPLAVAAIIVRSALTARRRDQPGPVLAAVLPPAMRSPVGIFHSAS